MTVNRGLVNRDDMDRKTDTNLEADDHLLVREGDIVYNMMRMWQGAFGRSNREGIVSPAYVVLRPLASADSGYFEFAFRRARSIHLFWAYSYGITNDRLRLYGNDFLRIPFSAPTISEQRRIADFLGVVDKRIQQLAQKKDLLLEYKKGVMQQIFTQALRFKDAHGNEFPEWGQKKYDHVYTFQNTNSFSRDLLTYDAGEVRNIHYGDIHTKFRSNFYLSKEYVPFIKPDVDISRISDDCYCRQGDIVIADASEDYGDVGKCIEIMDLCGQRTLAGLHTFIARPKKAIMAPGFGGYLMQCREMRLKIMKVAQGTKVLGVSKTQLSQLILPIPCVSEQIKIANFLTALDHKIEVVTNQIALTKAFKKGLLQQMFV